MMEGSSGVSKKRSISDGNNGSNNKPGGFTICVTSSRAPSSASGTTVVAAQTIDPQSGACMPLWNVDPKYHVQSLEHYPSVTSPLRQMTSGGLSSHDPPLYLVYGGSSKQSDMYAMLVVGGSSAGAGGGSNNNSNGGGHVKWKTRLPEQMNAGLVVSGCGNYVVGGGASGQCYLWDLLDYNPAQSPSGTLQKVWKSHYRSVTTMAFTEDSQSLLVGGADGIVHLYRVVDLVDMTSDGFEGASSSADNVHPLHTWSEHHLDVTDIVMLGGRGKGGNVNSHRAVSSAKDQALVVMELFSGNTLAKLCMPSGIECLACTPLSSIHGQCVFAGAQDGIIYKIDLDVVAMAHTAECAIVVSAPGDANQPQVQQEQETTTTQTQVAKRNKDANDRTANMDRLFASVNVAAGAPEAEQPQSATTGITMELRGHQRSISALALVDQSQLFSFSSDHSTTQILVSGDTRGGVRLWNTHSGVCTMVLYPWNTGPMSMASSSVISSTKTAAAAAAASATPKKPVPACPCSSITIVPTFSEFANERQQQGGGAAGGLFSSSQQGGRQGGGATGRGKKQKEQNNSVASYIKPLTHHSSAPSNEERDNTHGQTNMIFVGGAGSSSPNGVDYERRQQNRERLLRQAREEAENISMVVKNNATGTVDVKDNKDVAMQMETTEEATTNSNSTSNDNKVVAELKAQLSAAQDKIERWQMVNNQLLQKIQQQET
jgi:WD40 repeat protein